MRLIDDEKISYDGREFDGKIEIDGYTGYFKIREKDTEKGAYNLVIEIPIAIKDKTLIYWLKEIVGDKNE